MATTIQIKRSTGTSAPATLKLGELAYTYGTGTQGNNGDRLFIGEGGVDSNGDANNITAIGGQYFTDQLDHVAGTLTASSALLVDSNKAIDEIFVGNNSTTGGTLKINEGTDNGSNYVGLKAPNNITTSVTFTLPSADGSNGQILTTDGSGGLSFASAASSSFTIAADSGTNDTFNTGGTLTFAGGTGYALTATGGGGGAGMRWAPHCTNVSVGDPGANGGGGGSHHPGCPTPSFAGGTGSKPTDITADPTNIWGSTSTVTYYGGNSGGGGASNPWGEGGGGGGAGGAGTAGDKLGPTYSDGGDGVQITSMAPDGQTYYWAGGGGGAGAGQYYASQTRGANGGLGGGGGASNYPSLYGTNGGGAFNSVASSPLGDLNGAGIKNSGGGGGGGSSPKTPGYGDMNGGPGYVLLRSTTANAGITTDMTLVGVTTTATSVPTKSSLIITITEVTGTTTLNTDIKGYVSRDGGTTYTQGTLQSFGATLPSNQVMVGFENLDISSQPSGSSMKYKITTHNQAFGSKSTAIKNVSLSWS